MKTKKLKGIDYGFRPESYGEVADPRAAILLNVKGTNRRLMIIDYWEAGKIDAGSRRNPVAGITSCDRLAS